jgi:hypothetical protein
LTILDIHIPQNTVEGFIKHTVGYRRN